MYEIAIVGLGPAGIFALASLPIHVLSSVLVFEQSNIGGHIALYGGIKANITKRDIVDAFRKIPRWQENDLTHLKDYADNECPLLSDVCKQMREWILPDIKQVKYHTTRMTALAEAENSWKIETEDDVFEAKKVILCIGSNPRTLNLPKASFPLSQCLCKHDLEKHVSAKEKVVVIGTAHSGTIIMKNLKEIGCKGVVGIYRDVPFMFARDGILGGIKQESETIADEIIQNKWGELTPTLISSNDLSKTYRAIERADVVLYSCGFEQPIATYKDKEQNFQTLNHDQATSQFDATNIWGFGIAFPSFVPETQHYDVGFKGFVVAIQNALPAILQS